jgi:hypothetical protein
VIFVFRVQPLSVSKIYFFFVGKSTLILIWPTCFVGKKKNCFHWKISFCLITFFLVQNYVQHLIIYKVSELCPFFFMLFSWALKEACFFCIFANMRIDFDWIYATNCCVQNLGFPPSLKIPHNAKKRSYFWASYFEQNL